MGKESVTEEVFRGFSSSSCRDVVPDPLSDLIISDDSDDDKVSEESLILYFSLHLDVN
jgi:hypothetical protein